MPHLHSVTAMTRIESKPDHLLPPQSFWGGIHLNAKLPTAITMQREKVIYVWNVYFVLGTTMLDSVIRVPKLNRGQWELPTAKITGRPTQSTATSPNQGRIPWTLSYLHGIFIPGMIPLSLAIKTTHSSVVPGKCHLWGRSDETGIFSWMRPLQRVHVFFSFWLYLNGNWLQLIQKETRK